MVKLSTALQSPVPAEFQPNAAHIPWPKANGVANVTEHWDSPDPHPELAAEIQPRTFGPVLSLI